MKRNAHPIEDFRLFIFFIFALVFFSAKDAVAQESTVQEKDTRPVKNMFESIWLIDNQTAVVPFQGTFEFDILHRFGSWENGYDDFYGIFAPSNIRMGFNYVPINKLQVGFGFTKDRKLLDFHAKYAIFQQGRSGGSPVNLTYLVNMSIDPRDDEITGFEESTDRFAYFHQLMIARKFNDYISLQAAGSVSYFNYQPPIYEVEGKYAGSRDNTVFSTSFLGRCKINDVSSLIANFDIPLTDDDFFDPQPNISMGIELISSSHAFQIFIGNYKWLVPQYNHMYNSNDFGENNILIGFNMTRLWNF